MSIPGLSARGGWDLIPEAALPASVRTGTPKDKEAYRAALGFEQVLLGQLVKSMAADEPGYNPSGTAGTPAPSHHVLDLRA